MLRQSSVYQVFIYQLSNLIKWISLGNYLERNIIKAKHIPKGIFVMIAPTVFLSLGITALIVALTLYLINDFSSTSSIYLTTGFVFILLGILINYAFEFVVTKKVEQIQNQSSQHSYLDDLKDIFRPFTDQIKNERNIFLAQRVQKNKEEIITKHIS